MNSQLFLLKSVCIKIISVGHTQMAMKEVSDVKNEQPNRAGAQSAKDNKTEQQNKTGNQKNNKQSDCK